MRAASGEVFEYLNQSSPKLRVAQQPERQELAALRLELLHRQQPLGRAGMAGDECRLSVFRARPVERQVFRRCRRLAVLVDAQHRHVEAPARKLEVVRIAAERRDGRLRREHQPHVVISLVLVEPVLAALVERHRFTFERRACLLRVRLARRFEIGDDFVSLARDIRRRRARSRARDFACHVVGVHQH